MLLLLLMLLPVTRLTHHWIVWKLMYDVMQSPAAATTTAAAVAAVTVACAGRDVLLAAKLCAQASSQTWVIQSLSQTGQVQDSSYLQEQLCHCCLTVTVLLLLNFCTCMYAMTSCAKQACTCACQEWQLHASRRSLSAKTCVCISLALQPAGTRTTVVCKLTSHAAAWR